MWSKKDSRMVRIRNPIPHKLKFRLNLAKFSENNEIVSQNVKFCQMRHVVFYSAGYKASSDYGEES